MDVAIVVLGVLALYHFVLNGILLPSWRMELRNRLFVLRDELRQIRIDQGNTCDIQAVEYVHDGVNTLLTRLHLLSLSRVVAIRVELENNPELHQQLEQRLATIQGTKNSEIKRVQREANRIVSQAIVANASGWFIYMVPVVGLMFCFTKLKEFATELLLAPSRETARLIPVQPITT